MNFTENLGFIVLSFYSLKITENGIKLIEYIISIIRIKFKWNNCLLLFFMVKNYAKIYWFSEIIGFFYKLKVLNLISNKDK